MNSHAQQRSCSFMSTRSTIVTAAIVLGFALTTVYAFAEEGFIGDANGCKVANPSPKPDETVQWNGKCVDGYADGKGVLQWYIKGVPSTRYEGTLHGGLLAGRGKLTMPNGATYDGQWLAGKQEGKGVQSMPDGTRYEGEWKNGQPDGRGVLVKVGGEKLEGEWSEGAYVGPEEEKQSEKKK